MKLIKLLEFREEKNIIRDIKAYNYKFSIHVKKNKKKFNVKSKRENPLNFEIFSIVQKFVNLEKIPNLIKAVICNYFPG